MTPGTVTDVRFTLLGTGTSSGVPVIACECATCTSSDPRDRRTRQFLTAEEIERGIPRLPGAGAVPGLVQLAPGHLVEAVAG